jgi:hypothetical protein
MFENNDPKTRAKSGSRLRHTIGLKIVSVAV